jgi:hypothetical protein
MFLRGSELTSEHSTRRLIIEGSGDATLILDAAMTARQSRLTRLTQAVVVKST